jgi:WD40 repeat protein
MTAILWNARTGEKLQTFAGHTSIVETGAISADGKRIFTGSTDGTVRIWDAETGKELAALYAIDGGNDWLVVTPDGHFDGSEGGIKLVSYRIAGTIDFVSPERLEELRKENRRPGLLAEVWTVEGGAK